MTFEMIEKNENILTEIDKSVVVELLNESQLRNLPTSKIIEEALRFRSYVKMRQSEILKDYLDTLEDDESLILQKAQVQLAKDLFND